jgi:hypothetical protein
MTKLKHLSALLAGCLLVGSMSGSALAQPRMDRDRDWDGGRDRQERDWRNDGRDWRNDGRNDDHDWRDEDRDWDRGRRGRDRDRVWRERDRYCYYVRREARDRFGDPVIRRYRVCED